MENPIAKFRYADNKGGVSWKVHEEGVRVFEVEVHRSAKWAQIYTVEHGKKTSRATMVTIPEDKARELYHMLQGVYGQENQGKSRRLKMTAQEIFDKVLFSLRKQGKASTKDGKCMYRGPDGLKCAVGHLIEDADYRPEWENRSVHCIFGTRECPDSLYTSPILLSRLQGAHDYELAEKGLAAWEGQMRIIATEFNLVYKEPTND